MLLALAGLQRGLQRLGRKGFFVGMPKRRSGAGASDEEDGAAWGLWRRWRKPRSGAGDDWHNLFITK